MSLYAWLDLMSIAIPFLAGFHPRLVFYRYWGRLFPALLLTMIPFILWDVVFTAKGYWGFNAQYLGGSFLFGLPAEEWLFFICIPYACVFTHHAIVRLGGEVLWNRKIFVLITGTLAAACILILILFHDKAYTVTNTAFVLITLGIALRYAPGLLKTYYVTFLVMLIPFFIVNGILTGTGIEDQVVWYNDAENSGFRLFTIPVEDLGYAFSLILLNLVLFEKLPGSKP